MQNLSRRMVPKWINPMNESSLKSPRRPPDPNAISIKRQIPPELLKSPDQILIYLDQKGHDIDTSIPIEEIIDVHPDITLKYEDLGINEAYIKKISDNKYEIGVNKHHHKNRQMFSIAHEYAHYLLHRDKIDDMEVGEQILHRNADKNPIEKQANNFAAELLMPERLVMKALKKHNAKMKPMADELCVSQQSLEYRLKQLGYKVI